MNKLQNLQLLLILIFTSFVPYLIQAQQLYTDFSETANWPTDFDAKPVHHSLARSGAHLLPITSRHTYAGLLTYPLPDSMQNKNLKLEFEAWFWLDSLPSKAIMVISLEENDSLLYWHGIRLDDQASHAAEWFLVQDSIQLPASYTTGSTLKAYIWNQASLHFFLDEISISLSPLIIPGFMPQMDWSEAKGMPVVLTQNRFYELLYFPETASLLLADNRGRQLTRPLGTYAKREVNGKIETFTHHNWKLVRTRKTHDKTIVVLRQLNPWGRLELIIEAKPNDPRLSFVLHERLRKSATWHRRALAIGFYDEVQQVLRKNSLLHKTEFQAEYYLDRHGMIAGEADRTLALYHLNGISSAQLHTEHQLLLLNLDYAKDHPMVHFPLRDDTLNYHLDLSASHSKRWQRTSHHFQLYAGAGLNTIPRIMPVPNGYEAAIVWTEHADWTELRTHRAVNFGHEDIEYASDAIGGFVKYNIPVTKSVFYDNPDGVRNDAASKGLFTGHHASIKTDREFFGFLKQLHAHGHEICLHTPEQFTTSRKMLFEALSFMQYNFGSPTWIDHGYNNSARNNRENLVCDGLLPESPQYARELWQAFGVKYFWNPYHEELLPFQQWGFNGQLQLPYPGYGDLFPDRMISRHPNFNEALLWSTSGTLEITETPFWDYLFHTDRLEKLVRNRSVYIIHAYPAWVHEHKGFWRFDGEGKIVAPGAFNRALERMAAMREQHSLLPATISRMLRYQEGIQQVRYTILEQGRITLTNSGDKAIEGLSLAVEAEGVKVNGLKPKAKQSGKDLIFWFDLGAGESCEITYW